MNTVLDRPRPDARAFTPPRLSSLLAGGAPAGPLFPKASFLFESPTGTPEGLLDATRLHGVVVGLAAVPNVGDPGGHFLPPRPAVTVAFAWSSSVISDARSREGVVR